MERCDQVAVRAGRADIPLRLRSRILRSTRRGARRDATLCQRDGSGRHPPRSGLPSLTSETPSAPRAAQCLLGPGPAPSGPKKGASRATTLVAGSSSEGILSGVRQARLRIAFYTRMEDCVGTELAHAEGRIFNLARMRLKSRRVVRWL